MDVHVRVCDAAAADGLADRVWPVYAEAFGTRDEPTWRDEVWERHRRRADFRLATAEAGDALVGFAWGYTGELGQWFPDRVLEAVGEPARPWLGGHFEFVELAVSARARGRGVGRRLHDALLAGLPHGRAVLATSRDEQDPAVRLYVARGWRRIGWLGEDAQVMGLRQPGLAGGDPDALSPGGG